MVERENDSRKLSPEQTHKINNYIDVEGRKSTPFWSGVLAKQCFHDLVSCSSGTKPFPETAGQDEEGACHS